MKTKITILALVLILIGFKGFSQIPLLSSRPTQTDEVIYLDFDGDVLINTLWNTGDTIVLLPSILNSMTMYRIWQRTTEDFIPFNVNVTTDSNRFNAALPNKRMRVIITPSNAWLNLPGAGGIAMLDSYSWGGTPGTPCFVFENMLSYSAKNITEAVSHEVGHTLSLSHQGLWDTNCNLISEYHTGFGSGSTSWAPLMGVGYYSNVTIWHNGTSSDGCNAIQADHDSNFPGMTFANFLSFMPDDVGDNLTNSKLLNLNTGTVQDSGLISQPSDVDAFKFSLCNSRNISIRVKPWALDTVNFNAANLDISLTLFDASSNMIASHLPINQLKSQISIHLQPGDYYFVIDGSGAANYSDYGSLGRYYIDIRSDNIPSLVSSISVPTLVCPGEQVHFSGQSTGTSPQWQWNMPGATPSVSSLQSSTLQFSMPGIYKLSLQSKEGLSASCTSTIEVTVQNFEACKMTGLEKAFLSASLSIYPNPSTGLINIESSVKFTSLKITDVWGKLLFEETHLPKQNHKMDLNPYTKGFYFIEFYSEQTLISTKKIILE